jgi:hypothetical protein
VVVLPSPFGRLCPNRLTLFMASKAGMRSEFPLILTRRRMSVYACDSGVPDSGNTGPEIWRRYRAWFDRLGCAHIRFSS